ncbi:MAG: 16S rRNA (cytosine(1402)-N(4))-methyltransferase, partial [Candidatus Latescibacterota bacterium]|nr:16S rRNA (cytosine(1402)-N(4))-methyltransferase [Candidatus Latescibacterota bacterium]
MQYHEPVMEGEVLEYLVGPRQGLYLDATIGGGGHGEGILGELEREGHLIACDRDSAALNEAGRRLSPYRGRVTILRCAFSSLADSVVPYIRQQARGGVDGALFVVGVSSHQIDEGNR